MNIIIAGLVTAAVSYLLGSLNFAVIISKIKYNQDIRDYGSGNAGMTNMLRIYGKTAAAFTTIGDFGKAVAAVLLGQYVFFPVISGVGTEMMYGAYLAGIFVLFGHLFPLFFGFKGGKGLMTIAGIFLFVDPLAALVCLIIFCLFAFSTKIVSIGTLISVFLFPFIAFAFQLIIWQKSMDVALINSAFSAVLSGIVLFMHRSNVKRLLNGTENKFGKKK